MTFKALPLLITTVNLLMWLVIGLEFLGLLSELINSLKLSSFASVKTHHIVIKILNILIVYELFSTLTTALERKKIEIILVLDTALIFLLRELLILVFSKKSVELETGASFALIFLSLGFLRLLYSKLLNSP